MNTESILEVAVDVAREVGAYLKESVGKVRSVERKFGQETNLVTNVDKRAEEIIIGRVRKEFPAHGVLAEESGGSEEHADTVWVIDPLDGTTNFTHALPIFCVSIGVQHKGELVAGVVYDPNQEELFSASKGEGAYLNGTRLRVTTTDRLMESLIVTGFPYNIRENPFNAVQHFKEFLMVSQGVRRLGSAALDLSYVAAGRFEGFWEVNLNPWDMAAGIVLIREAGGMVTDFRGGSVSLTGKNVLATNGNVHQEMMEVLRRNL